MNTVTIITAAISVAFMAGAFLWSVMRILRGRGVWRVVHSAIAVATLTGAFAVYANNPGIGVLSGLVLTLLALAAMLYDPSRLRWLAFIPFFAAILLAAGVPFVTG